MNDHHWSGWPEAWCFKCGASQDLEHAIGVGDFDPFTGAWISEERENENKLANICPVSGNLVWNAGTKSFDLVQ